MTVEDSQRPERQGFGEAPQRDGLATGQVDGLGVFSQGLAAAAPSVALASGPASIFLIAGKGTLWATLIGAVVVVIVAYVISLQARRTVSSGSLGAYVGNGLGPGSAFMTGWALLIGYIGFGAGGLLGAVLFLNSFISKFESSPTPLGVKLLLVIAFGLLAMYIPIRGVAFSVRTGLALEVISLVSILVIIVAAYIAYGVSIDTEQFSLSHLGSSSTFIGAVTAVGAYAGFESAASLGSEAKNPFRSVPRAIMRVALLLGVLYLIAAYPEVQAFDGPVATLDPDAAALPVVAANANVLWTTYLVDLSLALAALVFSSAVLNSASRTLFTLSREGALPGVLGRVHTRHKSPAAAITLVGTTAVVVGVIATLAPVGRLQFDVYIALVALWGYMLAYLLVCVATFLWLRRIQALTWQAAAACVLGAVAVSYVMYRNLWPLPAFPYSILPLIFLALFAVGAARYGWLRFKQPEVARQIGSIQTLSEEEKERLVELELRQAAQDG